MKALATVSGLEPFEIPPPTPGLQEAHDRALCRIGWALLSLNEGRYQVTERHLTEAMASLQELQRIQGGKTT